jgi:hypothetical protein
MTRKDYVAIAQAISDGALINCMSRTELAMNTATRYKIAEQIADVLWRDNPRFDRARFLKACGVQS